MLVERFGLFALAAVLTALLHLYGRLPFEASLLIGGAFATIAMWMYLFKQAASFKPFRIIIGIEYEALRADLNLAACDIDLKFENTTYIALSPTIYSCSDERLYSSQLALFKQVPCGKPAWLPSPGDTSSTPVFYFRPVRDGYQFGVWVKEEWWKAHRQQLGPTLREGQLTFDNELVLGLLPYGYFPGHVRRWEQPVSFLYRFDSKQRQWEKRLKRHGWTSKPDDPAHIFHRYLGISYSDI